MLLDAERVRDRRRNEAGIAEVREVDEIDAVRERIGEVVCGLQCEPGLAATAGAGQREQSHVAAAK